MGNTNRANDITEQRHVVSFGNGSQALTSGETGVLAFVPYPCHFHAANVAAFSVASNAHLMLTAQRFIPGAGYTTWALGSTFTPPSFGTSGIAANGISLGVLGGTLLTMMPGDVVGYQVFGGATAGIFGFAGALVFRSLQDVKVYLGYA